MPKPKSSYQALKERLREKEKEVKTLRSDIFDLTRLKATHQGAMTAQKWNLIFQLEADIENQAWFGTSSMTLKDNEKTHRRTFCGLMKKKKDTNSY